MKTDCKGECVRLDDYLRKKMQALVQSCIIVEAQGNIFRLLL